MITSDVRKYLGMFTYFFVRLVFFILIKYMNGVTKHKYAFTKKILFLVFL